jgi:hypothetical protein
MTKVTTRVKKKGDKQRQNQTMMMMMGVTGAAADLNH